MSRSGAIVCTAALLLGALSGCTLDATSLNVFAASNEREWVMSGAVETISTSAQNTLRDSGVFVNVTHEGEAVRVASCTKEGKKFALVLNRVKDKAGEKTRVRIQWEDQADNQFWFQLLETVGTAQAQAARGDAPLTK